MTREQAIPYVAFVVDDAGNGRELGADPTAIVRDDSVLVGWQCGFEPLFVSVHSYLNVPVDLEEAQDAARDFLAERNWFGADGPTDADYLFR